MSGRDVDGAPVGCGRDAGGTWTGGGWDVDGEWTRCGRDVNAIRTVMAGLVVARVIYGKMNVKLGSGGGGLGR